ncbi:unnamed protein product, partial [Arabidopsis halleri]
MAMSDLTQNLVEEVLLRVPLTSLRAVRSTCKNWNTLSKNQSFTKKHLAKAKAATKQEFPAIMILDFKVYLMSFDLRGIHKDVDGNYVESSIKREAVYCYASPKDIIRGLWFGTLVVDKQGSYHEKENYAFGYEMKNQSRPSYKILRFLDTQDTIVNNKLFDGFEIYNLDSNSWKSFNTTLGWNIPYYQRGVSLKGNTYWFGKSKYSGGGCCLISFDFTTERFVPGLQIPISRVAEDTVTLSSVRDEQLAVLFQRRDSLHMEIWITTEIEPKEVWWGSKLFLTVNIKPLTCYQFPFERGSFFVDEEKKVAVIFG